VDLVGGDTEEEDFTRAVLAEEAEREDDGEDDENTRAINDAFSGPNIFGDTKFSVFRDTAPTSFFGTSRGTESGLMTNTAMAREESQLEVDEQNFFNLPSSDPLLDRAKQMQESRPTEQPQSHTTPLSNDDQVEDVIASSTVKRKGPFDTLQRTSAQSPPELRIKDMPPPALPALQTANFDGTSSPSMPPPPPLVSALPRSPKTPDIRPQRSAALPLPSPFPGEELSSYVDFSPQSVQTTFATPSAGSSPVLPDWMLQIGFGFGSQGFLRDSPPKRTREAPLADEAQPEMGALDLIDDIEDVSRAADAVLDLDDGLRGENDVETRAVPTRSKVYSNLEGADEMLTEENEQPGLGISSAVELSSRPQEASQPVIGSTTTHAIELSNDSSDEVEEADEIHSHASEWQPSQPDLGSVESMGDIDVEIEDSVDQRRADDSIDSSQTEIDASEEGIEVESGTESGRDAGADADVNAGESDTLFRYEGNQAYGFDGHADLIPELAPSSTNLTSHDLPPDGILQTQESAIVNLLDSDGEGDQVSIQVPIEISEVGEAFTVDERKFPAEESSPMQSSRRPGTSKREQSQDVLASSPRPETYDLPDGGSLYEPSVPPRSSVTFASRVTRRRATLHAEVANDLELQSSAPLTNSQQPFQVPRLGVQDTFEGLAYSDGSLTTAPPSRGSDGSVLHPIREDAGFDASSTPVPAPSPPYFQGPASFDGAHDKDVPFIASSPALVSTGQLDDVSYPVLPLTQFETVQSHMDRINPAREMRQDGHSLFTPEATQLLSFDESESLGDVHHEPKLPLTPHQTQVEQSFYDAIAGDESHHQPDPAILSASPEMAAKALSKLSSDPASSVLSPWFDTRSARKSGAALPKESDDGHTITDNVATQKTHTLRADTNLIDYGKVTKAAFTTASDVQEFTESAATQESITAAAEESINSQVVLGDFSFSQSQAIQVRGLLTSISYYSPLSALISCIRMPVSNSQSYNDGCVDVIAVVTKATTKPLRADKGQRDYYTTMSITDEFFYPNSLRVQVFRPWRAALPKAETGDVVLLRGFEVFSAKGNVGVGLKSAESAAWCVWRGHSGKHDANGGDDERPWTKHERVDAAEEDMRGPPVELGEQERQYARKLKAWYKDVADADMSGRPVASL
jgi:hypothetical protein